MQFTMRDPVSKQGNVVQYTFSSFFVTVEENLFILKIGIRSRNSHYLSLYFQCSKQNIFCDSVLPVLLFFASLVVYMSKMAITLIFQNNPDMIFSQVANFTQQSLVSNTFPGFPALGE